MTQPLVPPDFHSGVLTITIGVLIAIALKRYKGNGTPDKIERLADFVALPCALLATGAALAGLLTQETDAETAAVMGLFSLLSLVAVSLPFLIHAVIYGSPAEEEDDKAHRTSTPVDAASEVTTTKPESKKFKVAIWIAAIVLTGALIFLVASNIGDLWSWFRDND